MKRWLSSSLQASTASSLISLAAFALLTTIGVAEAVACTCALVRTETSCRDLADAKAIFAGEVISIAPVMRDIKGKQVEVERRVTLRVLEAFDGVAATEVTIVTATNSAACGYHFDKGRRYLVYAFGRPDGALTTSICSRTKPLANIGGELSFLRATATRQTTRVTGRVRLREDNSFRPVVGARFVLSAGERRYEGVSDRDGEFAVEVPAGKYGVELILPDNFHVEGGSHPPRELDLSDTRACPHIEVVKEPGSVLRKT
jgi:hypothetical protein